MDVVLQAFLDRLENAVTIAQLRDAMAAMAASFGLHAFAYIGRPHIPDGKPLLITNYAEGWSTHYAVRQYHRFDPVVLRAWQYPEPFEWGQELGRTATGLVRAFFDEAACFGIRYGYTIPIRCWRGRTGALTVAADRFQAAYSRSIRESSQALQSIAHLFHAKMRENLGTRHVTKDVTLTYRQRQCIELAEQGKSFGEIAQLTSMSVHTAKFHIDNVKRKFGVRSTREATILYALAKQAQSLV
jgi:LuxR family transcriptional activator of conjugal transfer of Ti plasmids